MRKRDHNLLTNAASLLICGLLAGVVVAAAAFPAVAMSGLAAKAGAETFDKLPTRARRSSVAADQLRLRERRQDAAGHDVRREPARRSAQGRRADHAEGDDRRRGPPLLRAQRRRREGHRPGVRGQPGRRPHRAGRLDAHHAVGPAGASRTRPSTRPRSSPRPKTPTRASCARCATPWRIEKKLTKEQILERYLNIAPFGNGAYGIFAASQVYFNKPPKNLTIDEAAHARRHGQGARRRTTRPPPGGYPQARRAAQLRARPDGRDRRDHRGRRQTTAKKVKLVVKGKRAPNGCVVHAG